MQQQKHSGKDGELSGAHGRRGGGSYASKRRADLDKRSKIWFKQPCRFHRCSPDAGWMFNQDQVIKFLRYRVDKNDAAWVQKGAWHRLSPPDAGQVAVGKR